MTSPANPPDPWTIGTFAFAAVAAGAAAWSAIVGTRQMMLAAAAQREPKPTIFAEAMPLKAVAGWTHIVITIDNRSEVPLELISATETGMRRAGILTDDKVLETGKDGAPRLRDPFPADEAKTTAEMSRRFAAVHQLSHRAVHLYVHRRPEEFEGRSRKVRLRFRWRTAAVTTFEMAVTIASTKRMAS